MYRNTLRFGLLFGLLGKELGAQDVVCTSKGVALYGPRHFYSAKTLM